MTPTEQDKELREQIADLLDELCEPTNKFWHRDSGLHWASKVMKLITADRRRVALEARVDELTKLRIMFERLAEYADDKEWVMIQYDDHIAELKEGER